MNISALSQQLQQVSVEQKLKSPSTPKRPSSKRKSKSDYTANTNVGSDTNVPTQSTKRSPKASKATRVKHLSTPSKPTAIPNSVPQDSASQTFADTREAELAAHYAGPTFHSSPAPSSLPMPPFFAASKQKSILQNTVDFQSPSEQSTPVKTVRSLDGRNFDDSPLALFFKADQEEKLRLRKKHAAQDVFASPTLRPSSADGVLDHLNIRSESPLLWNDSPHKPNGRFDFKNQSTSELPFQMESEFDNCNPPRNHLLERFRTTTEPVSDYRQSPSGRRNFNHSAQRSLQDTQFSLRESTPQQSNPNLETSTQTLKNLLSIQPLSSPSIPAPTRAASQSSSPSQHHRTQSAVQQPISKPTRQPQRIVSSPGIPHPKKGPPSNNNSTDQVLEDDRTTNMEKELRKVLNLS